MLPGKFDHVLVVVVPFRFHVEMGSYRFIGISLDVFHGFFDGFFRAVIFDVELCVVSHVTVTVIKLRCGPGIPDPFRRTYLIRQRKRGLLGSTYSLPRL